MIFDKNKESLTVNKDFNNNIPDFSRRKKALKIILSLLNSARTLVTLALVGCQSWDYVLVGYELHEDFSKHIGKLVCRHGAKPCNKETELLGTLKASITTT